MIANLQFLIVIFSYSWSRVGCTTFIHCKQSSLDGGMDRTMYIILCTLSWERVSKLIKIVHQNREEYPDELTQREIDLACGLKDKRESI